MHKKSLQLCGFACVMGIFAAFARWIQNQAAFEPETLLATPHSPWSYSVLFLLLLTAAALFLWVRTLKNLPQPQDYPRAVVLEDNIFSIMGTVISLVLALGAALTLYHAFSLYVSSPPGTALRSSSIFYLILGILAVICAIAVFAFLHNGKSKESSIRGKLGSVIIVAFICFWLVSSYKSSYSDPVIWHFAIRLIAISVSLLAFYFIAGFVYAKPKPLSTLYFSLLGAFLCIVSLADNTFPGEQILFLAFAALQLLISYAMISRMTEE